MTREQISSGEAVSRGILFERRFWQYTQSYTQSLLKSIFKSDIHLPSAEKEWHIPEKQAFPSPPVVLSRFEPLEEHETSYFAAFIKVISFFSSMVFTVMNF